MKKILTASQMKEYDAYTIREIGVPAMVLMERAAYSVLEEIKIFMADTNLKPSKAKVLIVCGNGNNGGDGLALARMLVQEHIYVSVVMSNEKPNFSIECEKQYRILGNMGVEISTHIPNAEYDIVVDALFGIGLSRPIEGEYAHMITQLNQMEGYKIALDIPSGLCSDRGLVLGCAFKADKTISFGYIKRGLLIGEAPIYAGQVVCKDIGIVESGTIAEQDTAYIFEDELSSQLPKRLPNGNKGTFGKVYIYAGCMDTIGAALLCAKSAFRCGAGMVKILCPSSWQKLFMEQLPEVMLTCYDDGDCKATFDKIRIDLDWADAVVIGPGIGCRTQAKEILLFLLKYANVPMVLDADALNLISKESEVSEALLTRNRFQGNSTVITPHMGEMARLLHASVSDLKADPFYYAKKLSDTYGCIAVCKDARTLVAYAEKPTYVNTSGNHGMATAGSGDVLAGIIGCYFASQEDCFDAAVSAVYLHGLSGDFAAGEVGERALTASNIIEGMISLQKGN